METFDMVITIDGKDYDLSVEAPDEATAAAYVNDKASSAEGIKELTAFAMEGNEETEQAPETQGTIGKLWEKMGWFEEASREGLNMIADAIPEDIPSMPSSVGGAIAGASSPLSAGQNYAKAGIEAIRMGAGLPRANEPVDPNTGPIGPDTSAPDIALRAGPKIGAEALAQVAPSFVSRGSIATAGILKGGGATANVGGRTIGLGPAAEAVGGGVARLGEALSGIRHHSPGAVGKAAKDASLFFARGSKSVSKDYDKIKWGHEIPEVMKGPKVADPKKFISVALELAKNGVLNARTAFAARKQLDAGKKSFSSEYYENTKKVFDKIAKTKTAAADAAYYRGKIADSLRKPLPIGKGGDVALLRMGIGGMVGAGAGIPGASAFMSPLVQGASATAIGKLSRMAAEMAGNAGRMGSGVGAAGDLIGEEETRRRKERE